MALERVVPGFGNFRFTADGLRYQPNYSANHHTGHAGNRTGGSTCDCTAHYFRYKARCRLTDGTCQGPSSSAAQGRSHHLANLPGRKALCPLGDFTADSVSTITGRVFYLGDSFFSLSGNVSHSFQISNHIVIVGLCHFQSKAIGSVMSRVKLFFCSLQFRLGFAEVHSQCDFVFAKRSQRRFHLVHILLKGFGHTGHFLNRI